MASLTGKRAKLLDYAERRPIPHHGHFANSNDSENYIKLFDGLPVFYSEGLPAWAVWIRRVLSLYPPFNMSLAYYQISKLAASNVDIEQGMTVPGPGFAWRDLWRAPDVNESGIMGLIWVDAPTTAGTFSLLLCRA